MNLRLILCAFGIHKKASFEKELAIFGRVWQLTSFAKGDRLVTEIEVHCEACKKSNCKRIVDRDEWDKANLKDLVFNSFFNQSIK